MIRRDNSEFVEALKYAFRFLGYRARTEEQVRTKLLQLGYSQTTVDATLERLRSLNLLNDESYARDWALSRVTNLGYGPKRIESELRQKGVAESVIGKILEETFAEHGERERAKALLAKKFKDQNLRDQKVLRRVTNYLHRRGYSESTIDELFRGAVDPD